MINKILFGVVLLKFEVLLMYECGGGVWIMFLVLCELGMISFIIGYMLFDVSVEIFFYSYNC